MKVPKWVFGLGVLVLLSPMLLLWAVWLRIKYRPLPPIPRSAIRYQIRDVGLETSPYEALDRWKQNRFQWQLSETGQVVFDAPSAKEQNNKNKILRAAKARKLGLRDAYEVWAIQGDQTLVWRGDWFEKWQGTQVRARCRNRIAAYLKWPIYDFRLEFLLRNGEFVGNGRIATAPASSGGASEPHGRQFPLLWDGKSEMARDLNEFVDPKNGFYLFRALAVNARGQILCLGQKTDAIGAEKPDWNQLRRLILTPSRPRVY